MKILQKLNKKKFPMVLYRDSVKCTQQREHLEALAFNFVWTRISHPLYFITNFAVARDSWLTLTNLCKKRRKKIFHSPFNTTIFKPRSVKWESSGMLRPETNASVKKGKIGPKIALKMLLSVSAMVQIIVVRVLKISIARDLVRTEYCSFSIKIRYMSGKITGATFETCESPRSLTNSFRTRTHPWTANSSFSFRAAIKMSNNSGQWSGQSHEAMVEIV